MIIDWDEEPTATHYTSDDDNWYEAWWKEVDGQSLCKFIKPEHWQPVGWHVSRFKLSNIVSASERPAEVKMTKVTQIYKTTDGEVFTHIPDAEDHQRKIDIWNDIVDKFGSYGTLEINYLSDFLEIIQFYEENK